mmetsp:Transcript_20992/g.23396  ORF Transcript_20992/g.23396 Transcript_20992/m.23396 type:complete len:182 (-) Transcript_20992:205-750(-)
MAHITSMKSLFSALGLRSADTQELTPSEYDSMQNNWALGSSDPCTEERTLDDYKLDYNAKGRYQMSKCSIERNSNTSYSRDCDSRYTTFVFDPAANFSGMVCAQHVAEQEKYHNRRRAGSDTLSAFHDASNNHVPSKRLIPSQQPLPTTVSPDYWDSYSSSSSSSLSSDFSTDEAMSMDLS